MKLRAIISTSIVVLALTLCYSLPAFAIANVSILRTGNGVYVVQGTNLEDISGMDVSFNYDTTLGKPTVTAGGLVSGSMLAANADNGFIHIGIVTVSGSINGTGQIAVVTFDKKGAAGNVSVPKVSLYKANLTQSPVTTDTVTPTPDPKPTNQDGGGTQNTGTVNQNPGTVATQPIVVGGTVTMPTDTPAATENKTQPAVPEYREEPKSEQPVAAREPNAAPEAKSQETQAKSPEKKLESQKSVLGRFRDYKGELSPKGLIGLFDQDEKSGVKQEPAFLLADGKAVLKVVVPSVAGKQAPNFALKKARLVSLKRDADNNWVVEARPEKGAYDASLTMLLDESMVELPLVVAPKVDIDLDKSGKITEDGFKRFLKERGTEKAPKYDLNGDGRRDYIDDYIFTVNYLVAQNNKAKEKVKEAKPAENPADSKSKGKPSKAK